MDRARAKLANVSTVIRSSRGIVGRVNSRRAVDTELEWMVEVWSMRHAVTDMSVCDKSKWWSISTKRSARDHHRTFIIAWLRNSAVRGAIHAVTRYGVKKYKPEVW